MRLLFTSSHLELHHNLFSDCLWSSTIIAQTLQRAQSTLLSVFPPKAAPTRKESITAKSALHFPELPSFITWQRANNSRRLERTSALAPFSSRICGKGSSLPPRWYSYECNLFQMALESTQGVWSNAESILNSWWNILRFKQAKNCKAHLNARTTHFLCGREERWEFLTRYNRIMWIFSASASRHSYFLWSCWEMHHNRLKH